MMWVGTKSGCVKVEEFTAPLKYEGTTLFYVKLRGGLSWTDTLYSCFTDAQDAYATLRNAAIEGVVRFVDISGYES